MSAARNLRRMVAKGNTVTNLRRIPGRPASLEIGLLESTTKLHEVLGEMRKFEDVGEQLQAFSDVALEVHNEFQELRDEVETQRMVGLRMTYLLSHRRSHLWGADEEANITKLIQLEESVRGEYAAMKALQAIVELARNDQ